MTRYVACICVNGASWEDLANVFDEYKKILKMHKLLEGNKLSFMVFTTDPDLPDIPEDYPHSVNRYCDIKMRIDNFSIMQINDYVNAMGGDIKFMTKNSIMSHEEYIKSIKTAR
jgi:hypothetical protein